MCLPKEKGCLGVRNSNTFDLYPLEKWCWRLRWENGGLWSQVLSHKYGQSKW